MLTDTFMPFSSDGWRHFDYLYFQLKKELNWLYSVDVDPLVSKLSSWILRSRSLSRFFIGQRWFFYKNHLLFVRSITSAPLWRKIAAFVHEINYSLVSWRITQKKQEFRESFLTILQENNGLKISANFAIFFIHYVSIQPGSIKVHLLASMHFAVFASCTH